MKDYGQHRRKDNKLAVVVVGEASESEEEEEEDEATGEQKQEDIDHRTVAIETIGNKYVDVATTTAAAAAPAMAPKTPTNKKQVTDSKSSLPQPNIYASAHAASGHDNLVANRHAEDDNGHNESSEKQRQLRRTSASSTSTLSSGGNKILSDSSSLAGGSGGSGGAGLNRASVKDSLLHSLLKESNTNLKHNLINLSVTPYATATKEIGRITRHLIATQRSLQSGCALLHKTGNDINQLNRSFITLSTFMSINNKLLQ